MGLSVSLYDECMITSIRLVNFKNFADETLRLGPFTVIVGANASGKSNIRDAFRFLHGIGRGYTIADTIEGTEGWPEIRGAPAEVVRFEPVFPNSWSLMTLSVEADIDEQRFIYSITVGYNPISTERFRLEKESLIVGSETIYESIDIANSRWLSANIKEWEERPNRFNRALPILTNLRSVMDWPLQNLVERLFSLFRNTRFLDFSPDHLRQPSQRSGLVLSDSGRNLPAALEAICLEPDRKIILLSWLHELVPMDVEDFEFPLDANGHTQLLVVERSGRRVSSDSASDGTLRFLGVLTALLTQQPRSIYIFEDLDTGIHPARLWLLLDFIEREAAKGDIQVVTTTHSPALLTWMNDATFEHTSVVYRDDYWSDSIIRPIAGLYNLRELRKSTALGELFTSNWIGEALKFSEGEPDTDHLDEDEDEDGGLQK